MNGKLLDSVLLVAWLGTFLIVTMVHPGIASFLIAWCGAIALGWYNAVIRHDSKSGALRGPWWPTLAAPAAEHD